MSQQKPPITSNQVWFPAHMINPYFNKNYNGINDQDLFDLDQWMEALEDNAF